MTAPYEELRAQITFEKQRAEIIGLVIIGKPALNGLLTSSQKELGFGPRGIEIDQLMIKE